ncbi:hypothetical protein ACHQM5_024025 [Ranunculus cassubicifolius]
MTEKRKKMISNVDRLSALPDPITHQILSSLNVKEVVQTSVLSRRWRCVWKSTPFLDFDIDSLRSKGLALMNFVDCTLRSRYSTSIRSFNINCWTELDASWFSTWVCCLLARNVQDFAVTSGFDGSLELPHSLFTSNITTIKVINNGIFDVQLPISMCTTPKIRSLILGKVRLSNGNSKGELVITYPELKHLSLGNCCYGHLKRLTLSPPLLESLSFINEMCRMNASCKINIDCPNLKSLDLHQHLYQDYALKNLFALVNAHIHLVVRKSMSTTEVEQRIVSILTEIRNVSSLELHVISSKFVTDFTQRLEGFQNLKRLQLCTVSVSVCAIANFLERLPHIESFVWDRSYEVYSHPDQEEVWTSYLSMLPSFWCLRTVEFCDALQNEDELRFLKILLQKAVVLEEVIIRAVKQESVEFTTKLSNLPRASPRALMSTHYLCGTC